MKKVKREGEYSIYQKRSGRYAVQDQAKKWVREEEKTKILLEAGLIKVSAPKPAAPDDAEGAVSQEAAGGAEGGEESES